MEGILPDLLRHLLKMGGILSSLRIVSHGMSVIVIGVAYPFAYMPKKSYLCTIFVYLLMKK